VGREIVEKGGLVSTLGSQEGAEKKSEREGRIDEREGMRSESQRRRKRGRRERLHGWPDKSRQGGEEEGGRARKEAA